MKDYRLNSNIIQIKLGDCVSKIKSKFLQPKKVLKKPKQELILNYIIHTELIKNTYKYLVDTDDKENLCFLSGMRYNNGLIPIKIHKPELLSRSSVSVKAEPLSVYDMYQYNQMWGLNLYLMSHLHPGNGPSSVYPSMIDLKNSKRWENNFQLIGLIMNRTGFFRFFSSLNKNFVIKLIGRGTNRIDNKLYKLNLKES